MRLRRPERGGLLRALANFTGCGYVHRLDYRDAFVDAYICQMYVLLNVCGLLSINHTSIKLFLKMDPQGKCAS